MARVYQTFDKDGKPHPKWRFSFTDWQGKRKSQTGYPSKKQTERLAAKVEREHEEIRKGYRPPPKSYARHHRRPFSEIKGIYISWGESQGGTGGRPWAGSHTRGKRKLMDWWEDRLALKTLADVVEILSPVEVALQEIQNAGRANKTVQNYAETIKSFGLWCVKRGLLEEDPLKDLARFDTTPEEPRRAYSLEEIGKLLRTAPGCHGLNYEVALCTGLRANELRSLSIDDLDTERQGLILNPDWTKNRKPGFQPLPQCLMESLLAFASERSAERLYIERRPKGAGDDRPANPLLYVTDNPGLALNRYIKKADLEKKTSEGKIDFHALRTTFGTLLNQVGATEKEIQHLMRHRPRTITFDRYVKTDENRLFGLIETIGDAIMTAKGSQKGEISAKQKMAVGADIYDSNGYDDNSTGVPPVNHGRRALWHGPPARESQPRRPCYDSVATVRQT